MFGPFEFEQGGYNFTLYDIINKDFDIQRGSRISWFGDPYAATLDIRHIPTAILDFDHSQVSRDLLSRFTASPYFDVRARPHDRRRGGDHQASRQRRVAPPPCRYQQTVDCTTFA